MFNPIFPILNYYWYQKVIRKRLELTLSLFVLRVVTDYSDNALSLDNLALFAHRFYRRPDLHFDAAPSFFCKHRYISGSDTSSDAFLAKAEWYYITIMSYHARSFSRRTYLSLQMILPFERS